MPTKLSADSFLSAVRQSGLVEEVQLKKFWQSFEPGAGQNARDADFIADGLVDANLLSKWQIDKLLQGKHKGFFLGKYKLISLLGSGGMSAVYLAEHTLMRRRVAIKVLPQSRIEDSSYLERFHREAQAVASLDHPNIMRAYDVDQEGKVHFLVMEYIEGQSFLELVTENGPQGFVHAADYIRQSAEGLSHAHEAGMIHRDIKPGNILVDKRGIVKILDMGLAMFFDPTGKDDTESSLTIQHDERVLGTADYLSPEQALNSHAVDVRTDIYSLGCTFYFILTGHPPFPDGSLAQRLLYHQSRQPAPVENDRPNIPISLAEILRKMMEKRPADRYQTAREVQEALAKWLVVYGDAEWRERNALVMATANGTGTLNSNVPPPMATVVHPIARPVAPPTPPPVTTAPSSGISSPARSTTAASAATGQTSKPVNSPPKAPKKEPPAAFPFPAATPTAVAPRPETGTDSVDFAGFDPSEYTAIRDSSATLKTSSSSSTIKQRGRSNSQILPVGKWLNSQPARLALVGGAAALFLLLTVSYYAGMWTTTPKPTIKNREKVLEYEVGPKQKYKTISSALEALKEAGISKPTIRVLGSKTYTEHLDLKDLPAGTTLLAVEPGGPTLTSNGPEPLLDISGIRGFKIEGFNLDAAGKEIGIRLKGKLPQVGISGCVLTGFTKRGILMEGAQGSTTDRVLLDKVELKAGKSSAVGIFLTGGASNLAYISIESCKLQGPMSAGIVIDANCQDVRLMKNILSETGLGIRFNSDKRLLKDVGLANNTFFKLRRGIAFSAMPSETSEKLGFYNNLFAQIDGPEMVVEKDYDAAEFAGLLNVNTGNNWTDKPALDPQIVIFGTAGVAGVDYQFLSVDPHSPGFLAPSATSPQRTAPSSGLAEPYVGAIGPQ